MQKTSLKTTIATKTASKPLLVIGALSIFSVMALSGCSTTPTKSSGADSETAAEQTGTAEQGADKASNASQSKSGVEVIGVNGANGQDINGSNLNGEQSGQNGASTAEAEKVYEPIIYFDYDAYEVNDKGVDIAKYYAKILVDNPQESVKLVGNTDERGTPDYNLALGEKRAKAVAQVMMLYGVSQSQIDIVSMGEEQPAVDGHTEAAWAKNRRVQIEIKQ